MMGSTAGLIITSIVVVIILAASVYLVFYFDTRPARRPEASSERTVPRRTARQAAGWPEESLDLEHGGTEASSAAGRDAGAPAERAAGTASSGATAA